MVDVGNCSHLMHIHGLLLQKFIIIYNLFTIGCTLNKIYSLLHIFEISLFSEFLSFHKCGQIIVAVESVSNICDHNKQFYNFRVGIILLLKEISHTLFHE